MTWITAADLPEPFVVAHTESEETTPESDTASVTLKADWDLRHEIFFNILNNALEWPYAPGSKKFAKQGRIYLPDGIQSLRDGDQQIHKYQHCYIDLLFERPFGQQGEDPMAPDEYYSENIEPNGEMLKLPPESRDEEGNAWLFKWGSDPVLAKKVSAEEAPTRLQIGLDYVIRWQNMPTIPGAALTIVDHVNDDVVESPSLELSFEEETLLANAPVISRVVTADPSVNKFNMEIRLSHRAAGWNRFWNPRTGEFDEIWAHPRTVGQFDPFLYRNFPLTDMTGVLP